jgi:hypothetical protein
MNPDFQRILEKDGSVTWKVRAGTVTADIAKAQTGYRRWNNRSEKDRLALRTNPWLIENVLPLFKAGELD